MKIEKIFIHCTATIEGQDLGAKDIDRWHRQKGWNGIGYHYVVKLDGSVEKGRPDNVMGAHVRGYNRNSLGVTYVGGLNTLKAPADTRTDAQKEALLKLLKELKQKHPRATILGHRDVSKDRNNNGIIEPFEWMKHCPCFDAIPEYKHI
ncbi:N-acetylmuramoyl-L-alanine amidase [Aquimarina sp. 2201CG1-2-11]|uniref:N-acetylmuramoyl-L-alanine amidase n=1 Tax=Aquimarina discodermiae TaxID=3231043 RepID=UPI0034628CC3